MSSENPKNIIRSWNLQQNFASGPIVQDSLTPPVYGRIRTPFVGTWREQQLENALDWEANVDRHFKDNHYLEPIPVDDTASERFIDKWVVYGKVNGQQLFTAKELHHFHARDRLLQ